MKSVFIAATRQNDGKTMSSLGLFHAFQKRYPNIAYMKPVGQQYRLVDGNKIDKDAVLIYKTYNLEDPLPHMSPIAVPRGFTSSFITENQSAEPLLEKLAYSNKVLSEGKEFVLYEGTGHAGVGSVFDMSNGVVAKQLGTKVIMVTLGGVGSSIDEVMMNKACFDRQGVEVIGVIVNKVLPEKYDKISKLVTSGFDRLGLPVFGVVPMESMLSWPSIMELQEDLGAELLAGDENVMNSVERFVIGDMQPHDALNAFSNNTLLIVPGNREGLILTALFDNLLADTKSDQITGIIFTNGIKPDEKVMNLIKKINIPLLLVEEDSFSIASRINSMIFKVRADEAHKISKAQELVETYVNVDRICSLL